MEGGRILYVRGIGRTISKEELTIYFQSRKQSGGGDISSIDLNEDEAVITFEDEDGTFCLHLFLVFQLFRCFKAQNCNCVLVLLFSNITLDSSITVYFLSIHDQGGTFNICFLHAVEDKQLSYRLVVFGNR